MDASAPLVPVSAAHCALDDCDLASFAAIAADFGTQRYGYVVTPNVDHVIRLHDEPSFRALYAQAAYVLLDSRLLSHMLRLLRRQRVPVCTGSDLTANLLDEVVRPEDPVVLVGGTPRQADILQLRYGLRRLSHCNPPMGFADDPQEVERVLEFIERNSPFRFCLLAVGSPRQEMLAQALQARGVARGLALCVGASINFLTGAEQRAPAWMQRGGLEWLYRLLQDPRRMAYRYLVRGPRILGLLPRMRFVLRQAVAP